MKFLLSLLNYFIPEFRKSDPDSLRKAHLLIATHYISLIFLLQFGVIHYLNEYYFGVLAVSITFVIIFADLFIYPKYGSFLFSGNLIIFAGFAGFFLLILTSGGIFSPTIIWLIAVALTGFLFASRKSGYIWTALAFLTIIAFHLHAVFFGKLPVLYPESYSVNHFGLSLFGANVYIVTIVVIYEIANERLASENREVMQFIMLKNEELRQQKEEILTQRDQIEEQRDIATKQRDQIQKQNKLITESIQYAGRIQNAVLPPSEMINKYLPDHFILNIPRDIVSGDFYWMTQKGNQVIIAVADCTGHGVPGGFLSMLGTAFLNEIIVKIFRQSKKHGITIQSNEVLEQLREKVIRSLHQTGNNKQRRDGMDIALCVIDFDKMEMNFSGANNPAFIIRKKSGEEENITNLIKAMEYERMQKTNENQPPVPFKTSGDENQKITYYNLNGSIYKFYNLKGNKMPIGLYYKEFKAFTNQTVSLKKGDTIYLFSDGYIDQFGGQKGRKFLTKNFKNFLLSIQDKTLSKQRNMLEEQYKNWIRPQGENGKIYKQIDDVLVFGIRV